ncbi:MAG: hypothetical protein H6832_11115 [Planctomycetes bacterium]|nr:hypothetical protein [Planctomycetota bacterium]MCB9918940.1 hypothetical protein [Planctomycetota bacterium]
MQHNITADQLRSPHAIRCEAGSFEPARHYYPRTLNAQLHALVGFFLRLSIPRVVSRYCHLNPRVDPARLTELLTSGAKHLRWAGADLFHVTTVDGDRRMIVIETNSCPSGNKSMPLVHDDQEQGGYRTLIEGAFVPAMHRRGLPRGDLAVLYDKNHMECSGYAATLADVTGEPVWLVPFAEDHTDAPARFTDGLLEVRDEYGNWTPIRAALRYVTQKPWNRIPIQTKTLIFNPVIACLAGGRNKLVASKAYDFFNTSLEESGLEIRTPETIRDAMKEEVPFWVQRFGGHAVVKVPYSNAGQGVFTITNRDELEAFMETELPYEKYVVQSLIGNRRWSSQGRRGRLYQVGTMPNKAGDIFVADVRMMIASTERGFRPVAIYGRRARVPLSDTLDTGSSWDVLGTNLSTKLGDGAWDSDDARLMLMDRKDFNQLGIGIDELIDGYIQTVLSTIAIDQLADQLLTQKGRLRRKLFRSLDDDPALLDEILG